MGILKSMFGRRRGLFEASLLKPLPCAPSGENGKAARRGFLQGRLPAGMGNRRRKQGPDNEKKSASVVRRRARGSIFYPIPT